MACLLTRLARDDVQHFALSIQLASSLPDPSPAPHLYLAQLAQSPQESLAYFASALATLRPSSQRSSRPSWVGMAVRARSTRRRTRERSGGARVGRSSA